jgi:hypothetical protein
MWTLVKQFAGTVIPGVLKPLRVLWNEMIGFVFIVFGVLIMGSTLRKWNDFNDSPSSIGLLAASFFFFFVMVGYGVYSFSRARKINRSK